MKWLRLLLVVVLLPGGILIGIATYLYRKWKHLE